MDINEHYQNAALKRLNQKSMGNNNNNSACQQIVNEEQEYEQVFDDANLQQEEPKEGTIQVVEDNSIIQKIKEGQSSERNKNEGSMKPVSAIVHKEILIDDDKNKIIKKINASRPDTSEGGKRNKRRSYKISQPNNE